MNPWDKRRRDIYDREIGRTDKRVFLVEGSDDVQSYKQLFNKKLGDSWEQSIVITHAGKKQHVLELLKLEPSWLGIVDRDEWDDDTINAIQTTIPNLLVLPRFCMENYMIVPEEIWNALPEKQKGKITGGLEELQTRITTDLDNWVRHGVLWSVINPMWEGLRGIGFNTQLLDPQQVLDDERIKQKLLEWHAFMEPARIFQLFQERIKMVASLSDSEKIKKFVHGKKFWQQKVHPLLTELVGQESEEYRRIDLWKNLIVPEDWEGIWAKINR